MASDLQIALDAIKAKLPETEMYCRYYDGHHKLAFASAKFETAFGQTVKNMRDNLCPIVVDAPADRMEVLNFSGDDPDAESAVADNAWEIWQRETLELVSYEVHQEALKTGEGYLIVWPDKNGEAKFYKQDSRQCVVVEDEDTAAKLFAAKQWVTADKFVRVTLYYADRIEKFISRKKYEASASEGLKDTGFKKFAGNEEETQGIANPFGVIPMFKFKTPPVLNDAIPLQDALNKTLADRMVTQEFGAFPQRWAVGLAPPENEITGMPEAPFKHGQDRLWVASDAGVKFGEFSAASIEPYLKAANDDRLAMARATGTPLHFFGLNSNDVPSGEALKTLESRFTKKVRRLQLNFGTVWASVMKFALTIERQATDQNIAVQWQTPEQRSEKEMIEVALLKEELGVPPEILFEEIGYTKEDIAKFDTEPEQDQAVRNAQRLPNETQNQRVPQASANGAGN